MLEQAVSRRKRDEMTMSESDRSSDANDEDDLPIFQKIRARFQNPNVVWTNTPGPRLSFRGERRQNNN